MRLNIHGIVLITYLKHNENWLFIFLITFYWQSQHVIFLLLTVPTCHLSSSILFAVISHNTWELIPTHDFHHGLPNWPTTVWDAISFHFKFQEVHCILLAILCLHHLHWKDAPAGLWVRKKLWKTHGAQLPQLSYSNQTSLEWSLQSNCICMSHIKPEGAQMRSANICPHDLWHMIIDD